MTPTPTELRQAYKRVMTTLRRERHMRDRVFPPGHVDRDRKLAEIDIAIVDLETLGKGLANVLQQPKPEQPALLDVPAPKRAEFS